MIKSWEKYFESVVIPGIKLDSIIYDIDDADNSYKVILSYFYNTVEMYIDIEDKEKHIFKINDLKGDILKDDRVSFRSMIFNEDDLIGKIKSNITSLSLQEFYDNLPNMINVFGIEIKPMTFINEEELIFTIDNSLTLDEIIRIITLISGYNYDGNQDDYHIWSKK
jgi:hypothetical protein